MQFDVIANRISQYLAWIAGAIVLFGCAVPITIDVISRFFLGRSLVESFEISGFALAIGYSLGVFALWIWRFLELPALRDRAQLWAMRITIVAVAMVFAFFL